MASDSMQRQIILENYLTLEKVTEFYSVCHGSSRKDAMTMQTEKQKFQLVDEQQDKRRQSRRQVVGLNQRSNNRIQNEKDSEAN